MHFPINIMHALVMHDNCINIKTIKFFLNIFNNVHKEHLNKLLCEVSRQHNLKNEDLYYLSKKMHFTLEKTSFEKHISNFNYAAYHINYVKNNSFQEFNNMFFLKLIRAESLESIRSENFDDYVNITLLNKSFNKWSDFKILYEVIRREDKYFLKKNLQIKFT